MSDHVQENPVFRAFECFRYNSEAVSDLFPMFPVALHNHYFSEFILVRSGTCRIVRANQTLVASPGEVIYIAPLISHSIDSADGKPIVFDVVKYSATRLREIPSYIADLRTLSMDAASAHLPVLLSAEEAKTWHLDSIITECLVEYENQRFAWDLHIRGLLYLLITNLARCAISKHEKLMDQLPKEPDPILEIPAYIEEHISEPLRVEELARRCSLSYPWFATRFHDTFGLSCKQFIRHVRAQTVEQYLVYSDLDLAAISRRTGYTDCSHMVKDFRQMTGMTPGQFRSIMKIQGYAPFSCFSGKTGPNHPSKG